ncbi:response regulator receiver protein [Desulfovibrio sp. X2]|uniref:response regulator n=1 Tax=Desulfovibrio sp. X2 TaxID=941449 RepID=UPI000358D036|nr:response regulator [Desulfovibrio sp. X2]EPR37457.1 response regulator receiver protein [Desulfovibrio sp. X2]
MQGVRILLVDDEPEFVEVVGKRLARRGADVRRATSGGDALAEAAREAPDVAVVDLRMPGMDGLAVLRGLRAAHPGLPVILLTGDASDGMAAEGKKLGAAACLVKPVTLEELADAVRAARGGAKAGQPTE